MLEKRQPVILGRAEVRERSYSTSKRRRGESLAKHSVGQNPRNAQHLAVEDKREMFVDALDVGPVEALVETSRVPGVGRDEGVGELLRNGGQGKLFQGRPNATNVKGTWRSQAGALRSAAVSGPPWHEESAASPGIVTERPCPSGERGE